MFCDWKLELFVFKLKSSKNKLRAANFRGLSGENFSMLFFFEAGIQDTNYEFKGPQTFMI